MRNVDLKLSVRRFPSRESTDIIKTHFEGNGKSYHRLLVPNGFLVLEPEETWLPGFSIYRRLNPIAPWARLLDED